MKQILQDLRSGATTVAEIPAPQPGSGSLLIRTSRTLISGGTERMLIDFGKSSLLQKAIRQPDKVRQTLQKLRTDGLAATLDAVRSKLDTPLPMGYSNVGTVVACGDDVEGFRPGDRVVSNGHHAEYVCVPRNLCARVPQQVDDDAAAFTVIGAIALQGIRLLQPTLGETVAVIGLGLIGLVAVQLLHAHGCRVIGIDFDAHKLALARSFGAETVDLAAGQDPLATAQRFTRGLGIDAVLITASTGSNEPIRQAAAMCRKRGRIVLVGVVGLTINRADFYEKELTFQVSCSYGPGRYDPHYEEKGLDYPAGFVRWTEQRNFEAVLDMLADGRLNFEPLIAQRFAVADAEQAYALISKGNTLGILLQYPMAEVDTPPQRIVQVATGVHSAPESPVLGFIGAGDYARSVLVPAFARTGARLAAIASAKGISSVHLARRWRIATATTDAIALLENPDINAVVIATRHDSHARWVTEALAAGKHVFVEKPLALTPAELNSVEQARRANAHSLLMVGFNRRYAPLIDIARRALKNRTEPKSLLLTVNAGALPGHHWLHDPQVGGGRIIGECCHFIDLLRYLAGVPIEKVNATCMGSQPHHDTITISLRFADGTLGVINYFANGAKSFPKERLEIFCGGGILQIDNFRLLRSFGWPGIANQRLWRQDKGQRACAATFVDAIAKGDRTRLIPFDELVEVMRACFSVVEQF